MQQLEKCENKRKVRDLIITPYWLQLHILDKTAIRENRTVLEAFA